MAFSKSKLAYLAGAGNGDTSYRIFSYYDGVTDAMATITASAYFNSIISELSVNDLILIYASDADGLYKVTSVTTNVTVTSFIDASLISDGALTAAKTALAEGSIMIGNASGQGSALDGSTDTQILVGNGTTMTSVAVSGDATLANTGALTIAANAVELGMLASGITPSHVVKFAGSHSYAGGGTSDAATVAGVLDTDIVIASIKSKTNAGYLDLVVPTADTITFTFSADPGASTVVYYTVLRAAA